MAFAGLRGTGKFGTDERPTEFRETILFLNPNGEAPLTALMSKMKKEATGSAQINWWEEKLDITRVTTSAANTGGSTTFVINAPIPPDGGDPGTVLVPGMILQIEAATQATDYASVELVRITTVVNNTGTSTLTVLRQVGGSPLMDPVPTGTNMTLIGTSYPEGDLAAPAFSKNPVKLLNYCQIFRTSVNVTKTAIAEAATLRTGDPRKNDRPRKMFLHSTEIEHACLWGKPSEVTHAGTGPGVGQPRRTMAGLRHFLTTNRKVYTATPTESDFLDFLAPLFTRSAPGMGNQRVGLCGNGFLNSINKLAASQGATSRLRYMGTVDVYGMELDRWKIPQGEIGFKSHPLMNVHPVYTNSAFIIAPTGIIWRPLKGRDTKLNEDIQPNDADYILDEWLTEGTIEVHHEGSLRREAS
jgi:hypothetical protein